MGEEGKGGFVRERGGDQTLSGTITNVRGIYEGVVWVGGGGWMDGWVRGCGSYLIRDDDEGAWHAIGPLLQHLQ